MLAPLLSVIHHRKSHPTDESLYPALRSALRFDERFEGSEPAEPEEVDHFWTLPSFVKAATFRHLAEWSLELADRIRDEIERVYADRDSPNNYLEISSLGSDRKGNKYYLLPRSVRIWRETRDGKWSAVSDSVEDLRRLAEELNDESHAGESTIRRFLKDELAPGFEEAEKVRWSVRDICWVKLTWFRVLPGNPSACTQRLPKQSFVPPIIPFLEFQFLRIMCAESQKQIRAARRVARLHNQLAVPTSPMPATRSARLKVSSYNVDDALDSIIKGNKENTTVVRAEEKSTKRRKFEGPLISLPDDFKMPSRPKRKRELTEVEQGEDSERGDREGTHDTEDTAGMTGDETAISME